MTHIKYRNIVFFYFESIFTCFCLTSFNIWFIA